MKFQIFGKIGREIARKQRRRKLKNHNFSIISNTCVGGVISNSFDERFNSPTVNLIIFPDEFIIFCENLKEYSTCPLEEPLEHEKPEGSFSYPLGIIRGEQNGLPDIIVRFVHYSSFDEAKKKWEERFKRVNYDNIFILMEVGIYATERIMDKFESLSYTNKVFISMFSKSERWPHNYTFSFYDKDVYVEGNIYNSFNRGLAQYRWLDEFDYTTWLNTGKIKSDEKIKTIIYKKNKYLLNKKSVD